MSAHHTSLSTRSAPSGAPVGRAPPAGAMAGGRSNSWKTRSLAPTAWGRTGEHGLSQHYVEKGMLHRLGGLSAGRGLVFGTEDFGNFGTADCAPPRLCELLASRDWGLRSVKGSAP